MPPIAQWIDLYAATERIRRQPGGVDAYVRILKRLAAYAAGRDLTPILVADYLATRVHVTVTTRAFEWVVVGSFNRFLKKRGLLSVDLLEYVERPRGRRRPVIAAPAGPVARLAAWIDAPPSEDDDRLAPRNRRFCGVCLYAGLRISETGALDWADVDAIARELVVWDGKGGHGRRIPIAPPLGRLFAAVPRSERHGPLFLGPHGRLTIDGAEHIFTRYLPRVIGVKLSAHMLRRAFATRLDERGHSLRVVQELLGHSSLATTERYIGVDRARKRAAVDDLDGAWDDRDADRADGSGAWET